MDKVEFINQHKQTQKKDPTQGVLNTFHRSKITDSSINNYRKLAEDRVNALSAKILEFHKGALDENIKSYIE